MRLPAAEPAMKRAVCAIPHCWNIARAIPEESRGLDTRYPAHRSYRLILYGIRAASSYTIPHTQLILYLISHLIRHILYPAHPILHGSIRLISNWRQTSLGNRGSLRSHWGNLRNCIIFEEEVKGERGARFARMGEIWGTVWNWRSIWN
jgi:hypothetical protein